MFVPHDYDGKKAYPVILFLHGAGETKGGKKMPVEVGIGPAIKKRGEDVPVHRRHPAGREAAGRPTADDGKRALAMLDEVMKEYKIDPKRVYLTGLSMGGFGTWSLAAHHPDRWAAIVPDLRRRRPEGGREDQGHPVLGVPRRRGHGRQGGPVAGHDRGAEEGRRQAEVHRVPGGRAQLVGHGLRARTSCTPGCWSRRRSELTQAHGRRVPWASSVHPYPFRRPSMSKPVEPPRRS